MEEKLINDVVDHVNYDKILLLVNDFYNGALYFDMIIDRSIKNNNISILIFLIEKCKHYYERCIEETFYCAVKYNNLNLVKYAKSLAEHTKSKYALLNIDDTLEIICSQGFLEILQYIIESDITRIFRHSRYICIASRNGHLSIVIFLVEHGSYYKADNHRALCLAYTYKHNDIVTYLLGKGSRFPTKFLF